MSELIEKHEGAVDKAIGLLRYARELPYVVEVQADRPVWETMAAFNVLEIAVAYAKDCDASARSNRLKFQYRVVLAGTGSVLEYVGPVDNSKKKAVAK